MKSLLAAGLAALLLSGPAGAETVRIAGFACAGENYVLLRDAAAEGAYRLGRVENGGRRVRVVAVGADPAATPEALCGQVADLCGAARILPTAQSDADAPVCLAGPLD